jgi:hypothetical protein
VISTQTLTHKQRKFLVEFQKSLNATDAAMKVYSCKDRNSAAALGSETLRKLNIVELMDTMGLTDDYLMSVAQEGLKATRAIIVDGKVQGVVDHAVRHKYLETTLKLRGKLNDAQRVELTGKDGEPLKLEMLVGIGFLNKPKEEK